MPDFESPLRVRHNNTTIIQLRDDEGVGEIRAGRQGVAGTINLFNSNNRGVITLEAESGIIRAGQEGTAGHIRVRNANDKITINLNGEKGDILLANADCAEEFDVHEDAIVEPGSVMILESDRRLRTCDRAYDKRVAGVVSGAGPYRAAIILDRQRTSTRRVPVAVVGKVCCKVDARYGAIEVGDLLTTSPTAGHAMRATDPAQAFGAVIGKALESFTSGTGLLPLLVALQ